MIKISKFFKKDDSATEDMKEELKSLKAEVNSLAERISKLRDYAANLKSQVNSMQESMAIDKRIQEIGCMYVVNVPSSFNDNARHTFKIGKEAVAVARHFRAEIEYVDEDLGVTIRRTVTKEPGTDPVENQK